MGDAAIRARLRAWLEENLPKEWRTRAFPAQWPPGDDEPGEVAVSRQWHERLHAGGWIAPGWPVEAGGCGLGLTERLEYVEEMARVRAPAPIGFAGVDILGPALIAFGSDEQRRRFLPPILSAEELWCQGYSEPGAGSDLAALATRAERDGTGYVITGQKVWTSYGGRADWCFLLARTGEPGSRHRGISFFLVAMDSPGLEWRPIRQLTGERHFGELFLDAVPVPASGLVGREGDGWAIAMHSLAHERLLSGNVAPVRARLDALLSLLRGRAASAVERHAAAALEARLRAATWLQARALARVQAGAPDAAAWASMVKLVSTELWQAVSELAVTVLGAAATAAPAADGDDAALWAYDLLDGRAGTLYAGTSEVQRNLIAERGLGLPR
ncbi:MAG: acyl-CoA dehydrogenase family protein [Actinomycetota bacterium]|jgi:alkylation response protein AidB-like acyl-CoA dehydrogenase